MPWSMPSHDPSGGTGQIPPARRGAMLIRGVCALACALAAGGLAHAQTTGGKGAAYYLLLTMGAVQECIAADDLLRKSCARVRGQLPDKTRTYCELPATPFEARTARAYAAFKETFRAEIKENEADFAEVLRRAQESFDKQYARTRAGTISMMDLDSLSRVLADRCRRVEHDGLAPKPLRAPVGGLR